MLAGDANSFILGMLGRGESSFMGLLPSSSIRAIFLRGKIERWNSLRQRLGQTPVRRAKKTHAIRRERWEC